MSKLYITDGKYLIAKIECQDGLEHLYACEAGHKIIAGDPPEGMLPLPTPHEDAYDKRRAAAFPSTGWQLDCLWHAMNTGTMQKVEPFYSSIKAVKDKYPKPSN